MEKKSPQEGESVGKKIPDPEPIKDRKQGLFCSSFFLSYLPTARTSKTVPKFHGLRKKIFQEIDKRLSARWLQPAFTTSGEKRTPQPCCFHVGGKERGDLRLRRGGGSSRPCGGRTAGRQDGRTGSPPMGHPWPGRSQPGSSFSLGEQKHPAERVAAHLLEGSLMVLTNSFLR